jgi:hypothetical protein
VWHLQEIAKHALESFVGSEAFVMTDVTVTMRELNTPVAKEYAEFLLLQADMRSALAAIRLWHEKYTGDDQSPEEATIGLSLVREAIIQFISCFDKKAKYRLVAEDIYAEMEGALDRFNEMYDIRDAYVAHRFGPYRQCVIGVEMLPDGTRILSPTAMTNWRPRKEHGPMLIALFSRAAEHIDKKVKLLNEQVSASTATLTREQIDALPLAQLHGVGSDEIRMGRGEFQKKRRVASPPSGPQK